MLPPIPQNLWKIDDSTVGDHFFLAPADRCFYIWEYSAHKGFRFSPANNFISNLKIKPSAMDRSPLRRRHKLEAIDHAAQALRAFISRAFVETSATFVAMPGSKVAGDTEYDNRLSKVLNTAFHGWNADVRDLLSTTRSTPADHESPDRMSFDELLQITATRQESGGPPRSVVVVFDDVLNSGKHFKVAERRIREHYPRSEIRGLFLARCVRERAPP